MQHIWLDVGKVREPCVATYLCVVTMHLTLRYSLRKEQEEYNSRACKAILVTTETDSWPCQLSD